MNALVQAQKGAAYNTEDGRKALRDIFGMGLFDNVQVGLVFILEHPAQHHPAGKATSPCRQSQAWLQSRVQYLLIFEANAQHIADPVS